jgi:hypothetical protein
MVMLLEVARRPWPGNRWIGGKSIMIICVACAAGLPQLAFSGLLPQAWASAAAASGALP